MQQPMIERATEALRQAGLLGRDRVVSTERMTEGQASAVYAVRLATGRTLVLKTAAARVIETEALWLRAWRDVGVDTPDVYGHGVLPDATPYLLMEHLAGPSVRSEVEAGRLPDEETHRRTGRMLAAMHQVRGSGFGSAQDDHLDAAGHGQYLTLREQIAAEALPRGLSFALAEGAISGDDGQAVERAVDVLCAHARLTGSRYTHGDFRTGNILRTGDRLVAIDPSPALTHPYICLAYALLLPELHTGIFPESFLAGYGEVAPVDISALDAALVIRAGIMFDSFGRNRGGEYARRLPMLFARVRRQFTSADDA